MFKGFIIAITFLTRIPIKINFTYGEKELGSTGPYFPLVGGLLGILVAGTVYLIGRVDMQLGAVAGLLAAVLLTGGLHLDGAMDTADGIFSARTRERMLEIMKDSRVGAHGVTAAVVLLLTKFVSYEMALKSNDVFWIIPIAFVLSRWVMAYAIFTFPGARPTGLGQIFIQNGKKSDLPLATILTILPVIIFCRWTTLLPMFLTVMVSWLVCRSLVRILGGLTGDTYGALAELSEVVFIIIFVCLKAFLGWM